MRMQVGTLSVHWSIIRWDQSVDHSSKTINIICRLEVVNHSPGDVTVVVQLLSFPILSTTGERSNLKHQNNQQRLKRFQFIEVLTIRVQDGMKVLYSVNYLSCYESASIRHHFFSVDWSIWHPNLGAMLLKQQQLQPIRLTYFYVKIFNEFDRGRHLSHLLTRQ